MNKRKLRRALRESIRSVLSESTSHPAITESMYSQWKKAEDEKLAKHLAKRKQKTPDDLIDEIIQGLEAGTIDHQMTPQEIADNFCNRNRLDSARFYVADAVQEWMLGR